MHGTSYIVACMLTSAMSDQLCSFVQHGGIACAVSHRVFLLYTYRCACIVCTGSDRR